MKHGPNVWVARKGDGFTVKVEGLRAAIVCPTSQRNAKKIALLIAKTNRSELIVQGRKGRIRQKDSHGFDKFPPRG